MRTRGTNFQHMMSMLTKNVEALPGAWECMGALPSRQKCLGARRTRPNSPGESIMVMVSDLPDDITP